MGGGSFRAKRGYPGTCSGNAVDFDFRVHQHMIVIQRPTYPLVGYHDIFGFNFFIASLDPIISNGPLHMRAVAICTIKQQIFRIRGIQPRQDIQT
jgi:hypothetical protein